MHRRCRLEGKNMRRWLILCDYVVAVLLATGTAKADYDFRVNSDSAVGWDQSQVSVAKNSFGTTVFAWLDFANPSQRAICVRKLDRTGSLLGDVLDIGASTWPENPRVAIDGHGGFALSWYSWLYYGILVQRYDSLGSSLGSPLMLGGSTSLYGSPVVAMNSSGRSLVVWESGDAVPFLYARLFDSAGTPVAEKFLVDNLDGWGGYPAADIDESGRFVVAWVRGGTTYLQCYNASGQPTGYTGIGNAKDPTVAIDSTGGAVISWVSAGDIYAQRFDAAAIPTTPIIEINTDSAGYGPDVAIDQQKTVTVTWQDSRNSNTDIYAQRCDSTGRLLGANCRVNDDTGSSIQGAPHIAIDSSGNFVIVWIDDRLQFSGPDIFAQEYDATGVPQGSNYRVYLDNRYTNQTDPSVTVDYNGKMTAAWHGSASYPNVAEYNVIGSLIRRRSIVPEFDYVMGNDSGSLMATRLLYEPYGSTPEDPCFPPLAGFNEWAFRYDSSGSLIDIIQVPQIRADALSYTVSMNDAGSFLIATSQVVGERYSCWPSRSWCEAKKYTSDGIAAGSVSVSDRCWNPSPAISQSDEVVLAWVDTLGGNDDVFAQKYDSQGSPIGTTIRVNDDIGNANQGEPRVAMDNQGNFVVTWRDGRNDSADIYLQAFDSLGHQVGPNIRVNDDLGTAVQDRPRVSISGVDSRFVIVWNDSRHGNSDAYTQLYDFPAAPVEGNQPIADPTYASYAQMNPEVSLNNSNVYFVWQDNRDGKSFDIYARIVGWGWTPVNCCAGTTGNVNMMGIVDLSDLSAMVNYLTGGGYALLCPNEANINGVGTIDLSDLTALVSYLTGGGYVLPNCP